MLDELSNSLSQLGYSSSSSFRTNSSIDENRKTSFAKRHLLIKFITVNSPTDFIAIFGEAKDFGEFFEFRMKMNNSMRFNTHKISNTQENLLEINQNVLVEFKDKQDHVKYPYYRGKIIRLEQNRIKVFLVDEGKHKICNADQIITDYPDNLFSFPMQAKKCRLMRANTMKNKRENWSHESIAYFKELINSDNLLVTSFEKIESQNNFFQEFEVDIFNRNENKSIYELFSQYIGSLDSKPVLKDIKQYNSPVKSETISRSRKNRKLSDLLPSSMENSNSPEIIVTKSVSSEIMVDDEYDSDSEYLPVVTSSYSINDETVEPVIPFKSSNKVLNINSKKFKTNNKSQDFRSNNDMRGSHSKDNGDDIIEMLSVQSSYEYSGNDYHYEKKKFDNINDKYPSRYHQYFEDDDQKKPDLEIQKHICSDDTILTGYTPNVDLNVNDLTEQIRLAREERLKPGSFVKGMNSLKSNLNRDYDVEELVYEIISGINPLYNNVPKKTNALKRLYADKSQNINANLIIETIIKEVNNKNIALMLALDVLKQLDYCTSKQFIYALNERLKKIEKNRSVLGNSAREVFMKFLASLYVKGCQSFNEYKFLQNVPDYCCDMLLNWMDITYIRNEPTLMIDRLRCVEDFLKSCFDSFKTNNRCEFLQIYQKAESHNLDNTLNQDVIKASFKIVSLYSNAFIESMLDPKDRENSNLPYFDINPQNHYDTTPTYVSIQKSSIQNGHNFLTPFIQDTNIRFNEEEFPEL